MDDDGDVQPGAQVPDRLQHRVVHVQPRAVGLLREHAEVLDDLQADRAVADRLLEIGHGLLRPAGAACAVPRHVREHAEAVRVPARADEVDLLLHRIGVAAAAEVDQHAEVQLVHLADQLVDVRRVHRRVVVAVDDRELRLRHRMHRRDQRRPRAVVDDARRRELGRRAPARADLGGARRAGLARLDLHATQPPDRPGAPARRCAGDQERAAPTRPRDDRHAETTSHDTLPVHAAAAASDERDRHGSRLGRIA